MAGINLTVYNSADSWSGTNNCSQFKVDDDGWCVRRGEGDMGRTDSATVTCHGNCRLVDRSPENIAAIRLLGVGVR